MYDNTMPGPLYLGRAVRFAPPPLCSPILELMTLQLSIEWPSLPMLSFFQFPTPSRCVTNPNTLYTTLSCWCRNISRLSTLIHLLSELAIAAPPEHRRRLIRQAAALRVDLKRQQDRFIAFMRVSKRYVYRRVSDVFEEIQQQSSFLDALEKRLETLREQVDHLLKSYEEVETLESTKKDLLMGAYLSHLVAMVC
jgi:chaperonin cofactor prefoldin